MILRLNRDYFKVGRAKIYTLVFIVSAQLIVVILFFVDLKSCSFNCIYWNLIWYFSIQCTDLDISTVIDWKNWRDYIRYSNRWRFYFILKLNRSLFKIIYPYFPIIINDKSCRKAPISEDGLDILSSYLAINDLNSWF